MSLPYPTGSGFITSDVSFWMNFLRWFLQKINEKQLFDGEILFTDEANFFRNAIHNFHDNHNWTEENQNAFLQTCHKEQFSINVLTRIYMQWLFNWTLFSSS